jgi:hypothetical protein
MKHVLPVLICACAAFLPASVCISAAEDGNSAAGTTTTAASASADLTRSQVVLTVAESKRLIARGFKRLPEVRRALAEGRILIAQGSTNTYIAEELLGRKIEHGAFVIGQTMPSGATPQGRVENYLGPLLIERGKEVKGLSLNESLDRLCSGDLVVKGGNALDYRRGLVATLTGSDSGGTSGAILPYLKSKDLRLVIPIGLEKQIASDLTEAVRLMQMRIESLKPVPSMVLWTGALIVTEIEALRTVAQVEVIQVSAGGIGGAEGSVRLLIYGPLEQVRLAMDEVEAVLEEPPFYGQPDAAPTER